MDPLEGISTTLNNNEPSEGIVLPINTSADGVALFQYRTTTFEDDNTIIVCTAGQDVGTIHLTVFCEYMRSYNFVLLILSSLSESVIII